MERVLDKMAKQLNAYDEASLMHIWHKYAVRAQEFEPSKQWEEAVIALCLIQAVRWKNQLFNYNLANESNMASPPEKPSPVMPAFTLSAPQKRAEEAMPSSHKKATILTFPPKQPTRS